MRKDNGVISLKNVIEDNLPCVSIDLTIFGFHENHLKVLLLKNKDKESWTLPGGFILKEESLETAANRLLFRRTGLNNIFLQQFHVFGDPERTRINKRAQLLEEQYAEDEY